MIFDKVSLSWLCIHCNDVQSVLKVSVRNLISDSNPQPLDGSVLKDESRRSCTKLNHLWLGEFSRWPPMTPGDPPHLNVVLSDTWHYRESSEEWSVCSGFPSAPAHRDTHYSSWACSRCACTNWHKFNRQSWDVSNTTAKQKFSWMFNFKFRAYVHRINNYLQE